MLPVDMPRLNWRRGPGFRTKCTSSLGPTATNAGREDVAVHKLTLWTQSVCHFIFRLIIVPFSTFLCNIPDVRARPRVTDLTRSEFQDSAPRKEEEQRLNLC